MRQLLLSCLCLFFFHSASANAITVQTDSIPYEKFDYGLELGYDGTGYRHNFKIGSFASYNFTRVIGLEANLHYERQLNKMGFLVTPVDYNSDFLSFTISSRFNFGLNKRWFAKAGIQWKKRIGDDFQEKFQAAYPKTELPFIRTKDSEEALKFELGYQIPLKNGKALRLSTDFGYNSYNGLRGGFKIGLKF